MDKENKNHRTGPPDQEEIERIQHWILKEHEKTNEQINQRLMIYGLQANEHGQLYHYSSKSGISFYPVFENGDPGPQKMSNEETDPIQILECITQKGAKHLKKTLDRCVIGQEKAKKTLAVGIINHYRKIVSKAKNPNNETDRKKRNILMIGGTGVGKTYLIERISEELQVPFAKVNATSYTSAGYVGGDVEDIIRKNLLGSPRANGNVDMAEMGIVYIDEFDKISAAEGSYGPDVGGDKVQSALLTLMEGTEIDVVASNDNIGKQHMYEKKMRGEEPKDTINTQHILFILGGSFSSGRRGESLIDRIKSRKKLSQKSQLGFSAPLRSHGEGGKDAKDLEDVKPEDLVAFGMRHEIIGRISAIAPLQNLSVQDLFMILKKEAEDSLVKQYQEEFKDLAIQLNFEDDALFTMAEKAAKLKTGARSLESIMFDTLGEYIYELEGMNLKELTVTREIIKDPKTELSKLLENLTPKNTEVAETASEKGDNLYLSNGVYWDKEFTLEELTP
jgi:ATP-dependent Clp protease ATP-binding subunit ClpX